MGRYEELVGVYNADGGLRGEAVYVVGSLLGRAHCSLCDITHSPFRRKAEWDARARSLDIPFRLLHRNELTPEMAATAAVGYPVVLGRSGSSWHRVVEPEQLEACDGSVASFFATLEPLLDSRSTAGG